MDRQVAKELYDACEKALASLTEAEHAISKVADADERRSLMLSLAGVIADLLGGVRGHAVRQHPEIEPPEDPGPPDTELTVEESAIAAALTSSQLEVIDDALLSECAPSWRKVARVVGTAMRSLRETFPEVSDGFYAQRVTKLVESGALESQGNLQYMRFSEVRKVEGREGAV